MEQTELLTKVSQAIKDAVNNQKLAITEESFLVSDLGLESIDLLDVSSELENTIGKELDFKQVAESVSKSTGEPASMKKIKVRDILTFIGTLQ